LKNVLFYLSPPIVGAIIGLFTNWLAIKMLFRPLAEKRVLGLKLPFTPGVLPRERERIATSLGDTVAIDLLDEATIAKRIASPAFTEALKKSAVKVGHEVLSSTTAGLGSGINPELAKMARDVFIESLASISSSEYFKKALEKGLASGFDTMHEISLHDFVPESTLNLLVSYIQKEQNAQKLSRHFASLFLKKLQELPDSNKSLAAFIEPVFWASLAGRMLDYAYPELVTELGHLLNRDTVRHSMEKAGAKIIRKALDRFSPMQRLFIGIGQYDKAILENMPAVIADFTEAIGSILLEASTRKAFADSVSGFVEKQLQKPFYDMAILKNRIFLEESAQVLEKSFASMLMGLSADKLSGYFKMAAENKKAAIILDGFPELPDRIAKIILCWLGSFLNRFINNDSSCKDGQSNAAPVFAASLPCLEPARLEPWSLAMSSFLASFAAQFKKDASSLALENLLSIDEAKLEEMAELLSQGLSSLAANQSSEILKSMDIRTLVVEKIENLNMLELEQIILRIVDKELGAITILGGVLGAFIGIFQSIFFLFK